MKKRGESALDPTRNASGDLVLSPIAFWQTDDVWEYIGMCASGLLDTFSDFAETLRIYAHSGGTSCAVVSDSLLEGKQKKGGCGSRLGCYVCQQAVDKSLENMIDYDDQYAYARGLNQLNKFIRATRFDYTLRHWVGRTIKEGFVCIEPDTYHPKMLRMLTRFMLQLDYDEMKRAERAWEQRKFVLLPMEMMIAVDALQSMNGVARPFSIWADYRDIFMRGVRYDIPTVETARPTQWPTPKFLYVGDEWDSSSPASAWTGMRDPYYEAMTEGSGCSYEIKTLNNGQSAWDVPTEQTFSVDRESAFMISEFELDSLIRYYDRCTLPGDVTFAYKWYLQYGAIKLHHSQVSSHDEALRRTAFKDRLGLTLNYDIDDLVGRSIPYVELPAAAQGAWKDKETAAAFQDDMFRIAA
ncbi:3'-phosphoadenosine 5'-phosphosulfate sulfotransferase [Noviherbaspirillum malthae]|uniref:3'-phosphoadenosine 5'-phosphosulfate sulfotransferase n=1 Tax=Noviherbaspirillum malthae TaxID=1260987 RepID=UPI002B26F731|nr:3'-phosphoadenosine 5'-phosphosulfate sulfotransferase [Noviherbaspirillum malthae]